MAQRVGDVTRILDRVQRGDLNAADELLPLVYEELRKLAGVRMSALPPGQTLQATALVHEAWLRLAGSGQRDCNRRGHFFVAASEAMRRVLVERARHKATQKRGGGLKRVDLDHVEIALDSDDELLLALNEALARYAEKDRQGESRYTLQCEPGREIWSLATSPNHRFAAARSERMVRLLDGTTGREVDRFSDIDPKRRILTIACSPGATNILATGDAGGFV